MSKAETWILVAICSFGAFIVGWFFGGVHEILSEPSPPAASHIHPASEVDAHE